MAAANAGEAAFLISAYEEAAAHWRAALELMRNCPEQDNNHTALAERLARLLSGPEGPEKLPLSHGGETLCSEHARRSLTDCEKKVHLRENWRSLAGTIGFAKAAMDLRQGRSEAGGGQAVFAGTYCQPGRKRGTVHYFGSTFAAAGVRRREPQDLDSASQHFRLNNACNRRSARTRTERRNVQAVEREHIASLKNDGIHLSSRGTKGTLGESDAFRGIFRNEGEYWRLFWVGSESRLKHRKGMIYIACLLHHPGQQIAATDLIASVESAGNTSLSPAISASDAGQANATIVRGLGDAGAALDSTARAQYRRRLEDLRDELETAERNNDLGRAEHARSEIEFIQAEISAAVGWHGRNRKRASHTERARLAVTKAIKAALVQIRAADPELGRHLSLGIRTGFFCSYQPKQSVHWQV